MCVYVHAKCMQMSYVMDSGSGFTRKSVCIEKRRTVVVAIGEEKLVVEFVQPMSLNLFPNISATKSSILCYQHPGLSSGLQLLFCRNVD